MFATLLLSAALFSADPAADKLLEQLKPIQGKWLLEKTHATTDPYERKPGENDITLEFKETKIFVNGNEIAEITGYHADIKPPGFDVKRKEGGIEGKPDEAIYKVDGDKLTIAIYLGKDRVRPENFDKPTKEGFVVLEFAKQP